MIEIKSGDTVYTIMNERVIKFIVLSVDGETLQGVNDNGTFMFFVKGCYPSLDDCINGMKTFIGDGYSKEVDNDK